MICEHLRHNIPIFQDREIVLETEILLLSSVEHHILLKTVIYYTCRQSTDTRQSTDKEVKGEVAVGIHSAWYCFLPFASYFHNYGKENGWLLQNDVWLLTWIQCCAKFPGSYRFFLFYLLRMIAFFSSFSDISTLFCEQNRLKAIDWCSNCYDFWQES